jgi:hypothetical protein
MLGESAGLTRAGDRRPRAAPPTVARMGRGIVQRVALVALAAALEGCAEHHVACAPQQGVYELTFTRIDAHGWDCPDEWIQRATYTAQIWGPDYANAPGAREHGAFAEGESCDAWGLWGMRGRSATHHPTEWIIAMRADGAGTASIHMHASYDPDAIALEGLYDDGTTNPDYVPICVGDYAVEAVRVQ